MNKQKLFRAILELAKIFAALRSPSLTYSAVDVLTFLKATILTIIKGYTLTTRTRKF